MDLILDGLAEAWRLLRSGDNDIYGITARTVVITGTSTLVALLIGMLKPRRLVAIGADAAASLERVLGSNAAVRVRHPSYGGQVLFADAIRTLYEHSGEIRGST